MLRDLIPFHLAGLTGDFEAGFGGVLSIRSNTSSICWGVEGCSGFTGWGVAGMME